MMIVESMHDCDFEFTVMIGNVGDIMTTMCALAEKDDGYNCTCVLKTERARTAD